MAVPLCNYFNKCGGCTGQHIYYSLQLDNKKNILKKLIGFSEIKVFSDKEYFYRNRMDMIFTNKGIGFRKKGTWYNVIDIEKCVISDEKLNNIISEIRSFFNDIDYFDIKKQTGTFRYAVIRIANNSSVSFVLNSSSTNLSNAIEKIKEFSEISHVNNILVTYVKHNSDVSVSDDFFVIKGGEFLSENYLGKNFLFSVQGFFQNNHIMAEKMHDYVNGLLKNYDTSNYNLLDLYGGVGTFGIINADLFNKVVIVESAKPCIDAANMNIKNNNIKNAEAVVLDAMYLKKLKIPEKLFVITDPPRSGMHPKTILQLKILKPKVIIYVSCNIHQLAKDLDKFKNYEIKSVALFDLFPQTNHCEAIIELMMT